MRCIHKFYANMNGYFWVPCPLCGEEFGGHEWLPTTAELEATIPNPDRPLDGCSGRGICPNCTRAGRGNEAWKEWIEMNGPRWKF